MEKLKAIRAFILLQGILFLGFSLVCSLKGDLDKWFSRWVVGLLLISAYGIMEHIYFNKNK
jgi:hypothetical protein